MNTPLIIENNISTTPQPLMIENIIGESIYATINNVCAGNNIMILLDNLTV